MTWITPTIKLVAYFAGFSVVLGAVVFVCFRQYFLARRKGYNPIVAGAVVIGAIAGMLIIFIFSSTLIDDSDWSNAEKDWFFFLFPAVTPPLVAAALVAALPTRNARRAGARSTRFLLSEAAHRLEKGLLRSGLLMSMIGYIGLFGGLFVQLRFRVGSIEIMIFFGSLALLGTFLSVAYIPVSYFRIRATAPMLKEVVAIDPRPPVLYLRAFYQESGAFTWVTKEEMARYTAQLIYSNKVQIIYLTFEQYLSSTISREIGPFVALGNPEDFMPPEGAARDYAEDCDWQQQFLQLAETATAIVMEVSRSDNLRWEIAALLSHGWQRKLFVITPPQSYPVPERWLLAVLHAAKGIAAPPRWSEFSSELNNSGFQTDPADPGLGSVVSFDLAGSSEVIARGATDPEEYVTAIKRRLEALSLTHGNTQS